MIKQSLSPVFNLRSDIQISFGEFVSLKTQIWIAVSVYLLVAIIKKRLNLEMSLYTFLQILSVTSFEKTHILQVLREFNSTEQLEDSCNQLKLFDL